MPSSLGKACLALLLASGLASTLATEDTHQQNPYIRSLKHSRRSQQADSEAGPSSLAKRGQTYYGRATFYAAGLGACGNYNSPSDFIVALNAAQYGNMGAVSSWCGKTIAITYQGNTQYATIADACPGCPYGGLDMSKGLFESFASPDVGVFQMSWTLAGGGGGGNNNNNGNDGNNDNNWSSSSSSTPAWTWTPKPTPTSTWQPPSSTWTPPPSTSSKPSSTHSAPPSSSPAPSSSSTSSSASSSSPAPASAPTPDTPQANNLDSFAMIYQGLNQMAVAAAT